VTIRQGIRVGRIKEGEYTLSPTLNQFIGGKEKGTLKPSSPYEGKKFVEREKGA